jgi:hypothetical protein
MFGIIYVDGGFVYFVLITKSKCEPMILLVAMCWLHLVFMLVLLNIDEICIELKSRFRIIYKFPTRACSTVIR